MDTHTTIDRRSLLGGATAAAMTGGCLQDDGMATEDDTRPTTAAVGDEPTRQAVGRDAAAPDIFVFEDENGQATARTAAETYTGGDILAVAQQAIDAQLERETGTQAALSSDSQRYAGNGPISCVFAPGFYNPSSTLQLTTPGINRLSITTHPVYGVHLDTSGIDGGPVIELDPDAGGGEWPDRARMVHLRGFSIEDPERNRGTVGIRINDVSNCLVEYCRGIGLETALSLSNVWQGRVNYAAASRCGNSERERAAIRVGRPEDTQTHQAINHIQLNHLQGGPGTEYAYCHVQGTATRIDVEYPNPELAGNRGFVFDSANGRMRAQVRGAQMNGGAPCIEAKHGVRLQVVGGLIHGETAAIVANPGVPKLSIGGGVSLRGAGDNPVVEARNTWLNMSNFHIYGGQTGLLVDNLGMGNIGNGTVRDTAGPGVRGRNLTNHTYVLSDLNLVGVADESGSPVVLENVTNTTVDSIAAKTSRSVPAVDLSGVTNTAVGSIVPAGSATAAYDADPASSLL
jgi:hypothetical protein